MLLIVRLSGMYFVAMEERAIRQWTTIRIKYRIMITHRDINSILLAP